MYIFANNTYKDVISALPCGIKSYRINWQCFKFAKKKLMSIVIRTNNIFVFVKQQYNFNDRWIWNEKRVYKNCFSSSVKTLRSHWGQAICSLAQIALRQTNGWDLFIVELWRRRNRNMQTLAIGSTRLSTAEFASFPFFVLSALTFYIRLAVSEFFYTFLAWWRRFCAIAKNIVGKIMCHWLKQQQVAGLYRRWYYVSMLY